MAPRPIEEQLQNASPERKQEILSAQAQRVFRNRKKNLQTTFDQQTNSLDRMYALIYYNIRNDALAGAHRLSDLQKYEMGMDPTRGVTAEELAFKNELEANTLDKIIDQPKKVGADQHFELDLTQVQEFYTQIGIIKAKANHDLVKERQQYLQAIPGEYDEKTKNDIADYLAFHSESLPNRISGNADMLVRSLRQKPGAASGAIEYEHLLNYQLGEQFMK